MPRKRNFMKGNIVKWNIARARARATAPVVVSEGVNTIEELPWLKIETEQHAPEDKNYKYYPAVSMQFDKICRTCLLEEPNMKSVFDNDYTLGEAYQLLEMLMACTTVQVLEGDGLPTQICLSCMDHIVRSFTFKKRCEDSDSTLREMLRKSTILDDKSFIERQLSSDVALHSEEALRNIDLEIVNIKMEFEEGATHIDGLPISDTVYSECETMMEDANDLDPLAIQSVHNENTKPDTEDDVMHDKNAKGLDPDTKEDINKDLSFVYAETIQSVCSENTKSNTNDDLVDDKNDLQNNTLVNRILRSVEETEQPIYPCLDCTACFTDEYDLKIHKETSHNKCHVCDKVFINITRLRAHNVVAHGPKRYCCKECGKGFTRPFELAQHVATHTDAKPFHCELCNKRFKYSSTLTTHHKQVHSNNAKNYICSECGKTFGQRSYFICHVQRHAANKTHTCIVCQQKFPDSAGLAAHKKIHKAVKSYVCSCCGKGYHRPCDLAIHERTHTGEKPYVCNVCNKGFGLRGSLIVHLRSHRAEKPYTCNVCGLGCVTATQLKLHLRMHTGEKPYQCHLCTEAFPRSEYLKRHIKIHTGEVKHVCAYCNKGFYDTGNWKQHVNTHIGVKPYSCKICNRSFAHPRTLSKHLKHHSRLDNVTS